MPELFSKSFANEVNLVDLKDDDYVDPLQEGGVQTTIVTQDENVEASVLDFTKLTLVESPVDERNGGDASLYPPQTLHDCGGYNDASPPFLSSTGD